MRSKLVLVLVLVATSIFTAGTAAVARAELKDSGATESHWYGAPILYADTGALLLALSTLRYQPGVAAGALSVYALAPMVVHGVHGNWGRGGLSAGVRVGLPLVGAAVGVMTATCQPRPLACEEAGIVGGLIGMGAALLVDQLLLARDEHEAPKTRHALHVLPTIGATPAGGSLGLAGIF